MVRTRHSEDLECGDGRLDSSPCPPSATSCASTAAWDEPHPQEKLPFLCTDQDHEAELESMQQREALLLPARTWLAPEGHQKVLSAKHRRFLVSWLLRVSLAMPTSPCCMLCCHHPPHDGATLCL